MREARVANVAAFAAVTIIAQQIASKATRDTLFLTSFDATELPAVMLAAAGLAFVGVVVLSRLSARIGPARLVPGMFLVNAALFSVEAALQQPHPDWVAYALYLHVALFGASVISGYWSVINERFDPHSAKKYIGRIAAGATVGGVLGGLAAERVAAMFGPGRVLVLLAGLNVICALVVAWVARGMSAGDGKSFSGTGALRDNAYLRRIAGVVTLLALGGALLDFALKAQADDAYTEATQLAQFFALYYTAVSVATFLVQTFGTRVSLEKLGIGATIAMMPIAIAFLGAFGAAWTRMMSVVAVRGTATVLENSVFRSGYELLYTPVVPHQKRPAKLLIDVAGTRLGDAFGSGIVLLLLIGLEPLVTVSVTLGLAVVAAAGALILIARLQRGYVSQLAKSLRTGAVFLDDELAVDATTRQTLAETTMALDREKLLRAIDEHRKDRAALGDDLGDDDDLPDFEAAEVAQLLRELGRDETRRAASKALRKAARRHLGQIIDMLLDSSVPLEVRRRLPPIVASARSKRAVRGLMDALADPRFEVRYRVGLALSALCAGTEGLAPPRSEVFEIAAREVQVGRKVWESQRLIEDFAEDESDGAFGEILKERRDRSLEHVFNILSLALDRDTLRLSLQALQSGQDELRGTALEYLENVLPDDVRRGLWPYVAGRRRRTKSDRPPKEIVDDLLKSMDSLELDRKALLEKIEEAKG